MFKYLLYSCCLVCILVLGLSLESVAQDADADTDTTRRTFFLNPKPPSLKKSVHSERSMHGFNLPASGIYSMPEETQPYQFPFKGQYYLDLAVKAYRKEQKDKLGLGWLFKFLNAVSPYVHNQFEFGVYQINDLPIVERDNPLFQSHNKGDRN